MTVSHASSQALGRALVFPKIWSAMDRWWAPHSGKIPGSSLDLPFEAPFDHIVDLEGCAGGPHCCPFYGQAGDSRPCSDADCHNAADADSVHI